MLEVNNIHSRIRFCSDCYQCFQSCHFSLILSAVLCSIPLRWKSLSSTLEPQYSVVTYTLTCYAHYDLSSAQCFLYFRIRWAITRNVSYVLYQWTAQQKLCASRLWGLSSTAISADVLSVEEAYQECHQQTGLSRWVVSCPYNLV